MFSFRLDKKKLDKILPLCGNFVDIVYLNSKVIVASEDGICYSQLMFDAVSDNPSNKREGFRIETSILKRLAMNGRVEVFCSDTEVHLSMYGEGQDVIYKSSTPMMNSFIEFGQILEVVDKFENYDYQHITSESTIIKLASKFNDVFVSEGRFSYIYHNNSYIFCKSNLNAFCVDGRALKNVSSVIGRFKLIDNYLVFLEENMLVRLTRNKMPIFSDLEFIASSKALAKYELNFKRGNYLINSLGAESYEAIINITANKLMVTSNKGKFEAKVDVLNEKKKELSTEEKLKALKSSSIVSNNGSPTIIPSKPTSNLVDRMIKVPKWVFSVIGDYSNLVLFVKRSSCLVQFGNSFLVFQGGFINEN